MGSKKAVSEKSGDGLESDRLRSGDCTQLFLTSNS